MSATRPPRLAAWLVWRVTHPEDGPLALTDLAAGFEARVRTVGLLRARLWYWSQALRGAAAALRPAPGFWVTVTRDGLAGDVRHSVRILRRRPAYTASVVATLALGLASAAAVFAVVWSVWLRPLDIPEPDRVVRLFELEPPTRPEGVAPQPTEEWTPWRLSPPLLEDLRGRPWSSVSAVTGVTRNVVDWVRPGGTTRIDGLVVSPEAFPILGLQPVVGRGLADDPDANEVVLTRTFWRTAFGSDPAVTSRSMVFGTDEYAVVGVVELPDGYPGAADAITLLRYDEEQLEEGMRGARYVDVIARVRPGFTVGNASVEMARIVEELGGVHPNHRGWSGSAVRLSDELLRPYRAVLRLLLAAGVAFLLLAVVNVAGLVSARSIETLSERAVRLALGASRTRLLRSSVIRGGLVGALGGTVAVVVSGLLLEPIRALVPAEIPRAESIVMTPGLMAVTLAVALCAGASTGLMGHLLSGGLRSLARSTGPRSPGVRGRSVVVVSQVALTTLLVTTGVGILSNVRSLQAVDLGFEPDGVVSTQVLILGDRYPDRDARRTFWRALLAEVGDRGLEAGIVTSAPMAGVNMPWGYRVSPTDEQSFAQYHVISPEYPSIMGVELIEGRVFDDSDVEGGAPVVMVNDVLAERHFPGERAVGRTIRVVGTEKEIVGVVRATRHTGPRDEPPAEIYGPFTQDPFPHAQLVIRGAADRVGPLVQSAADAIDPALGLAPVASYDRFVVAWFASLRLQMIVVGVLATVGTALAMLGLYALVAYRILARRSEIGLRMALGASGTRMFAEQVRHGTILALVGTVVGLGAWYLLLPLASDLLQESVRADAALAAVVVAGVACVSIVASALPARRSVTVDPSIALKSD